MSTEVSVNTCPNASATSDMGDYRVLYSRCSMWFPNTAAQLSALRLTQVCTLSKSPGFIRISWQAFYTRCCNTCKSLIGSEHTKVFRCPQSPKPRGLTSGNHAGLHILSVDVTLRLLRETTGPKTWSPKTPTTTTTIMENRCWCLEKRVM
jgi:hypothetical protein